MSFVSRRPVAVVLAIVLVTGLIWTAVVRIRGIREPVPGSQDRAEGKSTSAKEHSERGQDLRERGLLRDAVAEFERSIEIDPELPDPYLGLAETYDRLAEEPELRLDAWIDALRVGSRVEESVWMPVVAYAELGLWKKVERLRAELAAADSHEPFLRHLDRLLAAARDSMKSPAEPEAWTRAHDHFTAGRWAEAAEEYRRALRRGVVPGSEMREAIRRLARCHDELGSKSRADWYRRMAAEEALFGRSSH